MQKKIGKFGFTNNEVFSSHFEPLKFNIALAIAYMFMIVNMHVP